MNPIALPIDNPLDSNPQTWLEGAQKFFVNLNSQAATEVIAAYQTARLLEKQLPSTLAYHETRQGLDVIKQAAKARMHYLVASTENRSDRRRFRKLFNAATESDAFMSLWDWVF